MSILFLVAAVALACMSALVAYVVSYRIAKARGYRRGWEDCLRSNGTDL